MCVSPPHLVCLFSFETACHSPESVGQNKRSCSRAPIKGATTQLPPTSPPPARCFHVNKHPLLGATCASVCVLAARGDFIPHYLILDNVSASVGAVLTTALLFFSGGCDWRGHSEVPPNTLPPPVKNHPPPSFAKQARGRREGKLKRKEKKTIIGIQNTALIAQALESVSASDRLNSGSGSSREGGRGVGGGGGGRATLKINQP